MEAQADIGVVGLAVMGQNLILNMDEKGYTVVAHNRTPSTIDAFLSSGARGTKVIGAHSPQEMIRLLKRPRRIMLMVKAGPPVDELIQLLVPNLEAGDIIIDGGNSLFQDTIRRTRELQEHGILFVGSGVSGGEEGARHGPSLMPGGNARAWPAIREIFQAIAARAPDGSPCCEWIGDNGAGHYVKMVHNGIEYGDMQVISEAYHLLKSALGMRTDEMQQVFAGWNHGDLNSYLIEITADILGYRDTDGLHLIDKILDSAGQKGTGKWTGISSLELGVPVTLISEAVYARCLSALKEEREHAAKLLAGPREKPAVERKQFVEDIRQALLAAKIISYAQGFMLLRQAAHEYNWQLNYGSIASIWRGGCIIRSVFLNRIREAYERQRNLPSLLTDEYFRSLLEQCQTGWRRTICRAAELGIPVPAFSTALSFYDGYRSAFLPANLVQAQRDYFGAHTYERTDSPRGKFFHTDWTGRGGQVASTVYGR